MVKQLLEDYEKETNAPFTDSLTGLFNHGFFQISLDKEVKTSQRYGDVFTLCLINIDSFSLYNRKNGVLQGDRVLKEISNIINDNIRQTDVAARYSGDTFAIILTKSDARSSFIPIERIRTTVEELEDGKLTISAGLASCPRDAATKEVLIQKAEEALMRSKVKGKNRVTFFQEAYRPSGEEKSTILVVDDENENILSMEKLLTPLACDVVNAHSGDDALSVVNKVDVDLILLDAIMPEMDGYEVCRRLKSIEITRLIPIVMVTDSHDKKAKIQGIEAGADDLITKPLNKVEVIARVRSLLQVNTLNKKLTSIENVLMSLANAVEANDQYTQGHTSRVSDRAMILGKRLGLTKREIDALRLGGVLHDIGKIGIPHSILNKPGSLNSEEWKHIKGHPETGYKICLPLKDTLGPALDIIRHHHEKIDGSGYPDGLRGEEISILARIMAVCDIYDALITDRPYRRAMAKKDAKNILHQEADDGKLDKDVVRQFMDMDASEGK